MTSAFLSYQANPTTKVVPYTHPVTGEEYQRLSNTNRAKTYAVMAIRFHEHDSRFCGFAISSLFRLTNGRITHSPGIARRGDQRGRQET
jgi:hypothetical protein